MLGRQKKQNRNPFLPPWGKSPRREFPFLLFSWHKRNNLGLATYQHVTVCPSGQGDGLEIHWALPAGVRIPSLSLYRRIQTIANNMKSIRMPDTLAGTAMQRARLSGTYQWRSQGMPASKRCIPWINDPGWMCRVGRLGPERRELVSGQNG